MSAPNTAPAAKKVTISNKLKILVVDDMPTMRKVIIHMLKEIGLANASEVDDGDQAWIEIKNAIKDNVPYELIVSDINMPKVNGLELLEKVRNDPQTKRTPFLIITVEDQTYTVMKAVQLGVSNYIVKPFSPNILKDKIYRIFAEQKE
ncbi:MAG: hypothetical protein A2504_00930 [Bdellovibrionales bacterium RIFOXYD12_FULL_39_22]|nr:MAG: hypothetical protein A2385_03550 [Bdellovibrionales bacterium RIFOXYB1_FULL_39_21]OFZ42597.1 MAG: hypothetical protein A2485_09755 [Bdellovibrionales bacterium RIFOXYC12_FULL_39_17]OFZ47135.1 MAG: hypothetical protein A2404_15540 [Bdellovibrionales bacterium RIFOXYC1_FULL_39_130]OFZ75383.1 MAG: hypothetical protein A2560_14315 [Bdellovibrionales bacterium RIFOXYD1_FULL_39_84]OFZ93334.1 MAG: hypothetical protein A2504_00930 [Bdellovibrionales bacterium RIFOXYD12_FULL_39_22]HLE09990.1 re